MTGNQHLPEKVSYLFHVSEEPAIQRFEPRPSKYVSDPVV